MTIDCYKNRRVTWSQRLFKTKDWRLVKTIEHPIQKSNPYRTDVEEGKLYVHFYENQFGDRQVEYASTFGNTHDDYRRIMTRFTIYPAIHRWLSGRLDPDIPTYDDVDREDFANKLSGKVD